MNRKSRCVHCRRLFVANPRVKNQSYCRRKACQRARKSRWQRHKMATDTDYQKNQNESQRIWQQQHPHYWRNYRQNHPDYCERNRQLQKVRDAKRRAQRLAKMDALKRLKPIIPGTYYLIPQLKNLAKMDALTQKINIIPVAYQRFDASCKKGLDRPHRAFAIHAHLKEGAP